MLIAPSAKSSGARRCSAPPHRVAIQLKNTSPKGTTSASAIAIPKIDHPSGIGAVNMFCIQASTPRTPIATNEPATARWANCGLRDSAATISEIAPKAGSSIAT